MELWVENSNIIASPPTAVNWWILPRSITSTSPGFISTVWSSTTTRNLPDQTRNVSCFFLWKCAGVVVPSLCTIIFPQYSGVFTIQYWVCPTSGCSVFIGFSIFTVRWASEISSIWRSPSCFLRIIKYAFSVTREWNLFTLVAKYSWPKYQS